MAVYFLIDRRIPAGHDGFQYFSQQYYFLNNVVTSGEIPQWMPYMTHGTVAAWWYSIQAGLLQAFLLITGGLFKNVNFLVIYNLGILLDLFVLLCGSWLLAGRFFTSKVTVFFVTASAMGSCLWASQPWWNFHIYHAIPLILYLGHRFIETGRWRYFLLAGNLLAIQTLGNLPYIIPVTSLVIVLYFSCHAVFHPTSFYKSIKQIRFGLNAAMALALTAASFFLVYFILTVGIDQIVSFNSGRLRDGRVSLATFLTYSGNTDLNKWLEMLLGISPGLDYNVFIGILPVPLIILGAVISRRREYWMFLSLIIVLILFSMAGPVSVFFYKFWPLMNFFRHLSLVAVVIKLFLCFLAGFGFEALFGKVSDKRFNSLFLLMGAGLFTLAVVLYTISQNPESANNLIGKLSSEELLKTGVALDKTVLCKRLTISSVYAFGAYLLIGFLPVIDIQKYRRQVLSLALVFHVINLYEYNFHETRIRTTTIDKDLYGLTRFREMPFAKRRELSFWVNNPRGEFLGALSPGVLYWSTHSFVFRDQVGNPFRADHWLIPLNQFMRAYWGEDLNDLQKKPAGSSVDNLIFPTFPLKHPAALKIAGLTEDKIQFFSEAYLVDEDKKIGRQISDKKFKGGLLFLSRPAQFSFEGFPTLQLAKPDLAADTQIFLPYDIQRFSANRLVLTVDAAGQKGPWLFYSDVWHPLWKADVNGKGAKIFKANLAYKALKLKPGLNEIRFYFHSRWLMVFYFLIGINALFWIGWVLWTTVKLCYKQNDVDPLKS